MDLSININDGIFNFGLYDKRDAFPFSIVRMPHKTSNLPSKIVYSSIGAECLRIARASNNIEAFSRSLKPLLSRMQKQGTSLKQITKTILKFYHQHKADFSDICKNVEELLNLIS